MRIPLRPAATILLLPVLGVPLSAQGTSVGSDSARVTDRMDLSDADHALVTRHGDVALLLAGDEIVIQLTDAGLAAIETGDMEEEAEGFGERLIGAMIRAGIREMLDNGLAYPVDRIERAEVVDGRLVLENEDGDEIFDLTVDDRDVMADFDERQARVMAREIRARM